jgi:V8-like Glu-specific endopeptidase
MGFGNRLRQRRVLIVASAAAAALATALAAGTVALSGVSRASTPAPRPGAAVSHAVGATAQKVAPKFWTPSRMKTATAPLGKGAASAAKPGTAGPSPASSSPASSSTAGPSTAGSSTAPPPGTPTAKQFNGVPTVGALFYTTGTARHFCTASVVDSATADMVLTAAHCVYSSGYASNVEFVPGYHDGQRPYGAWPVKTMTVASGWQQSHDPNLDFAFLSVSPSSGTGLPIQAVTGGLRLGINQGYAHPIDVIGYNDTDDRPVHCATKSFEFEASQMEFYCHDYWDGTSGGPWITGYQASNGTGTVIGDIGGYEQGGDYEWSSYSPYFTNSTLELLLQAEKQHA